MTRALVMMLGLTACNVVFELDATTPSSEQDRDDDGIPDVRDNCIEIANATQANADEDRLGDACDPCPGAYDRFDHDEDRDGAADACDGCPGIDDFHTDFDANGVGDTCDIESTGRLWFDAFIDIDPEVWTMTGVAWTTLGDEIAPTTDLPADDPLLRAPSLTSTGEKYWVDLGLASTTHWAVPAQAGVVLFTPAGEPAIDCRVECTATGCVTALRTPSAKDMQPIRPAPDTRLRLLVDQVAPNALEIYCTTDVEAGMVIATETFVSGPGTLAGMWPALVASPALHLAYVDVVD